MLIHPQFDPVAIQIGPLAIHWYGLMYLLGFVLFLLLGRWRIARGMYPGWKKEEVDDLLFYGVLGVILGGRFGYVFFYKPDFYLSHPLDIFKIWQGGMAFHGGFLGVMVAIWYFARKTRRRFFQIGDFLAPLVPLGLAAGRMGNFINGELWGRVTAPDAPWGMIFPQAHDNMPRHPSQLYQFALEGLALFVILWIYSSKARKVGQTSAVFLLGYGCFRFIAEFAREPDDFLGYLALNFSMGQWLSIPMILIGAHLLWWSSRQADQP